MNHGWMNVSPHLPLAQLSFHASGCRDGSTTSRRRGGGELLFAVVTLLQLNLLASAHTYSTSLAGLWITMKWIPRANVDESGAKVAASCQNKLSTNRRHCIIDSMETTVVDSFNERLIMDNRLNENDGTYVKYSQLGQTASERIAIT